MSETDEALTTDGLPDELSAAKLVDPDDERTQEMYRRAYIEQLRRQQCPGCGESDLFQE